MQQVEAAFEIVKDEAVTEPAAEPASEKTDVAEAVGTGADERQKQEDKCNEHAKKGKTYFTQASKFAKFPEKMKQAHEKYAAAVEEFTLAIELAEDLDLPWAGTLETLYNNRSAMYEKLGKLDEALTDTDVIVTSNKTHTKSRKRRAR